MQVKIGCTAIKLYSVELVDLDEHIDAIVSGASTSMRMDRGLAKVIKDRGGEEIEEEAMKKAPAPVGSAIVTSAGALNAKYVIIAVVVGSDGIAREHTIRESTINCLLCAEKLGIRSIGFPALGTVFGGVPVTKSAKVMIGAVKEHLSRPTSLETIIFASCFESFARIIRRELEVSSI